MKSYIELFWIFLKLGCTSFGGPIAHIGFFHHEFVHQRKWISDSEFSRLVTLCQILPGPASSQLGMSIGYMKHQHFGSFLAWLGFTLPSAIIMFLLALSTTSLYKIMNHHFFHALKIIAVIVVAHALFGMIKSCLKDKISISVALMSTIFMLMMSHLIYSQIVIIMTAAILGFFIFKKDEVRTETKLFTGLNYSFKFFTSIYFLGLLLSFLILCFISPNSIIGIGLKFYQIGSLVFGGGHVVLPLIQSNIVNTQLLNLNDFLTGYGFAQIIPGPMFTISTYVGAQAFLKSTPFWGALISTLAIFLPSFIVLFAVLPIWSRLHLSPKVNNIFNTINSAVIGLLAATYITPIASSGLYYGIDYLITAIGIYALIFNKIKMVSLAFYILLFYGCISILSLI